MGKSITRHSQVEQGIFLVALRKNISIFHFLSLLFCRLLTAYGAISLHNQFVEEFTKINIASIIEDNGKLQKLWTYVF